MHISKSSSVHVHLFWQDVTKVIKIEQNQSFKAKGENNLCSKIRNSLKYDFFLNFRKFIFNRIYFVGT